MAFRAVGSSIIVCRENLAETKLEIAGRHCAAVLENALEKAVRDPPPAPASTSKFDFLYSTLSRRQTKAAASEAESVGGKKKAKKSKERKGV